MVRRRLGALAAVLVAAVTAATLTPTPGGSPAAAKPDDRPNVVVIFADDMRDDDLQYMSKTRRLIGRNGMTFQRAVSSNPVCCPARATLLTGQYSHNTGVLSNDPVDGFQAFRPRRALPPYLQAARYRTAYVGKYLNGYAKRTDLTHVPPGWDEWRVPVRNIYDYERTGLNVNGDISRSSTYRTDLYTRQAVSILRRWSDKDRPFFMMVAHLAPHDVKHDGRRSPPVPAPRDRGRLRGKIRPLPSEAVNEQDMSDKPQWIRDNPLLSRATLRRINRERRARAESLLAVDRSVARVVRTLKRTGSLDDTIVVFTSDNGYLSGEHRKARGKTVAYEESVNVPLLARGPGMEPGGVSSRLVGLHDVAATVAGVSGVVPALPYELDGESLIGAGTPRRPMLLETGAGLSHRVDAPSGQRSYVGVRTDRYVYVRLYTGEEELYDLAEDPWQLHSLHDDPAARAVKEQLSAELDRLQDCVGVECRRPFALR